MTRSPMLARARHLQVSLQPMSTIIQCRKRGALAKEADTKMPLIPETSPRCLSNHFPSMALEIIVRTPCPQNLTSRKPLERTTKATWPRAGWLGGTRATVDFAFAFSTLPSAASTLVLTASIQASSSPTACSIKRFSGSRCSKASTTGRGRRSSPFE